MDPFSLRIVFPVVFKRSSAESQARPRGGLHWTTCSSTGSSTGSFIGRPHKGTDRQEFICIFVDTYGVNGWTSYQHVLFHLFDILLCFSSKQRAETFWNYCKK